MRNKIFYYSGFTQFENTGDLLINKTLLDIISSKGTIVVDDRNMPAGYKTELTHKVSNIVRLSETGVKTSWNKYIFNTLFKNFLFKKKDIYILDNPGHHISKQAQPTKGQEKDLVKKKVLKALGGKSLKIGVTLGPYSDAMSRYYAKTSKLYHAILVRDSKTLDLTKKYGFENVSYIPDLAWAYNDKKFNVPPTINVPSEKYIVLSFRDCIDGKVRDESYFNKIKENIRLILSMYADYKVVLSFQVEYDRPVCQDLYNTFKETHSIEVIDSCLSISDAMNLYTNAQMVISNRLHVLLLAIKANTLPIAVTDVEKHNKLTDMFYDEGVKECVFDINEKNLIQNFTASVANKQELLNKFTGIINKNTDLILKGIDKIF